MKRMEPLTPVERKLAEEYFYLVDEFLHRKRLNHDEYFDIVIFGYLQAIQRECRNPNPPENKNLHGLIEICMKRAVFTEWRRHGRDMRNSAHEVLSLDYIPERMDGLSLHDAVADTRRNTAIQVEARDLTARILEVATPREREAIDLACLGYETREIAQMLGIAINTAGHTLYRFRVKAKAVRDDREVIRAPQWVKDKEKLQARNRKYQQEHRAEINEKNRIRNRAYRAAHPEKVRAKERAYREAHRDEINARVRARYAAKQAEKLAAAQKWEKAVPDAANIRDGGPKGQI